MMTRPPFSVQSQREPETLIDLLRVRAESQAEINARVLRSLLYGVSATDPLIFYRCVAAANDSRVVGLLHFGQTRDEG